MSATTKVGVTTSSAPIGGAVVTTTPEKIQAYGTTALQKLKEYVELRERNELVSTLTLSERFKSAIQVHRLATAFDVARKLDAIRSAGPLSPTIARVIEAVGGSIFPERNLVKVVAHGLNQMCEEIHEKIQSEGHPDKKQINSLLQNPSERILKNLAGLLNGSTPEDKGAFVEEVLQTIVPMFGKKLFFHTNLTNLNEGIQKESYLRFQLHNALGLAGQEAHVDVAAAIVAEATAEGTKPATSETLAAAVDAAGVGTAPEAIAAETRKAEEILAAPVAKEAAPTPILKAETTSVAAQKAEPKEKLSFAQYLKAKAVTKDKTPVATTAETAPIVPAGIDKQHKKLLDKGTEEFQEAILYQERGISAIDESLRLCPARRNNINVLLKNVDKNHEETKKYAGEIHGQLMKGDKAKFYQLNNDGTSSKESLKRAAGYLDLYHVEDNNAKGFIKHAEASKSARDKYLADVAAIRGSVSEDANELQAFDKVVERFEQNNQAIQHKTKRFARFWQEAKEAVEGISTKTMPVDEPKKVEAPKKKAAPTREQLAGQAFVDHLRSVGAIK